MKWTRVDWTDSARVFFNRECKMAGNVVMSNGVSLELHKNYSGSGAAAFGGAKEWPHLTLRVAFPAGHEEQRESFAEKLRKFIDENVHA